LASGRWVDGSEEFFQGRAETSSAKWFLRGLVAEQTDLPSFQFCRHCRLRCHSFRAHSLAVCRRTRVLIDAGRSMNWTSFLGSSGKLHVADSRPVFLTTRKIRPLCKYRQAIRFDSTNSFGALDPSRRTSSSTCKQLKIQWASYDNVRLNFVLATTLTWSCDVKATVIR
jgi:hypothetical protein